jgi:hypothetical protein
LRLLYATSRPAVVRPLSNLAPTAMLRLRWRALRVATGRGASRTREGDCLTITGANEADVDANPSTTGARGSSRWSAELLCSEQCSSVGQIPDAPTIFFKSATIVFKFNRYKINFWFLESRKQGLKQIKKEKGDDGDDEKVKPRPPYVSRLRLVARFASSVK